MCLSFVEERVVFVCGRGQASALLWARRQRKRSVSWREYSGSSVVCYSRGEWLRVVQIELKLTFETTKELGD